MKTKHLFFITFLFTAAILSTSFAQDNTKVGLPEGAIARLGKGGINLMRFSPDGTRLVVGTDVGAWVYDVPDGKETALFTGHIGQVNAIAFSSDGKTFASGGFVNPVIQVWDVETKSKLSTVPLTREPYSLPALTFYGEILISTNGHREITYWHADTGQKLSESRLDNPINTVTFSQDGSTLAIGDRNGKIQLWDTTSSQQADLEGHGGGRDSEILALAFSPDGKILASGSEDKTVRLWDTQNHTKLGTLSGHTGWVTAVAFSEDGNTVASGDANKTIKLWDLDTQQARAIITGHKNTINALAFAPIGTPLYGMCLASGSTDGTIRFWNPRNGEELVTFTSGHIESVKAVAFSKDGTTLTTAAFNGIVDVWSLQTGRELTTFTDGQCDAADAIALSPDATYFVRTAREGLIAFKPDGFGSRMNSWGGTRLQLWNIATEDKIPGPWQDIGNSVSKSIFSPVHGILAVGSHKAIQAWHINTGAELFRFEARGSPRTDPVFSPDGKWLATIDRSGKAQVWNVEAPNEPAIISSQKAEAMAFSPDSSILAIATGGHICLWKFHIEAEDELTFIRGGLRGFKNVLTFSPDGTTLVGSDMEGWSNPIKLWDVETGKDLGTLSGHTEPIETLVFSRDGKMLASGSDDGTVLLWDWDKIINKREQGNNR